MLRIFRNRKSQQQKKKPTCLKELLLKFARILCFGALNSDPLASKSFSDNLREFCALEHSTQTHLPERASLKICENSVLWSTQLRPTCLKQLLGYFASSVLWSTFVQTHLPQKTEHEEASAGSAKRKQYRFGG